VTTRSERISEWLATLPQDGRFTTTDAYERFLRRWPSMRFSRMNAAQQLTKSGMFQRVDARARDQVWTAAVDQ
jgi:hypothetical protein